MLRKVLRSFRSPRSMKYLEKALTKPLTAIEWKPEADSVAGKGESDDLESVITH